MISNHKILYVILFSLSLFGNAQKEFSNWYFGDRAGLNFNNDPVSFHTNGVTFTTFTAFDPASISDAAGNLLFYFNSSTIYNKNHQLMDNGQNIISNNNYGSVIVPKPNTTNIYYLITSIYNISDSLVQVYYSEIDMNSNNGLGRVILKNQLLANNILTPKLTSVQHGNDVDFWLVSHGLNNNRFYTYLIDENGINSTPIVSEIGSLHEFDGSKDGGAFGNIKISHDAKRLATIFYKNNADVLNPTSSVVEVMNFDDITGRVEGNVLHLGENTFYDIPSFSIGTGAAQYVEFSPNNNYIYVSTRNSFGDEFGNPYPSSLYQFDVRANNDEEFLFSTFKLYSGGDRIFGIQWGLDDKLYVATANHQNLTDDNDTFLSLGVINNPNIVASGADYNHLSVPLSDDPLEKRATNVGLPQDIRQFFYLKIEEVNLCGGLAKQFNLNTSNEILSVLWDFGDGTTSTDINPEHSFNPGNYTVTVTATYENSIITRTIFIDIPNRLDIPDTFNYCDDISNDGSVNISIQELQEAALQTDDCGLVSFHFTQAEAQANINAIETDFDTLQNPQIVYLRLQQIFSPFNIVITPLTIIINEFPTLSIDNYVTCKIEGEEVLFDSSLLNTLFTGDISCANISYYLNETDANSQTNPITNAYVLPEGETNIYVRIDDLQSNEFNIESLNITVKLKPKLNLNDWYYLCPNEQLTIAIDESYDEYLWSTGEQTNSITLDTPGEYSVQVFNTTTDGTLCDDIQVFNVGISSVPETIDVLINDLSINNSIEVNAIGVGDYEYSLDGFIYQESPIFNNLTESEYTVYVRDKNGCGILTKDVFLLISPHFFTPNSDGVNDFWQIKSSFREPNLSIQIFDRFGKLLKALDGNSEGWDGTFNGNSLPTSDYWFKIFRPATGRIYTGHFTLKR